MEDVFVAVSTAMSRQLHLADLVGDGTESVGALQSRFCDRLGRVILVAEGLKEAFCPVDTTSRWCLWLDKYLGYAKQLQATFCTPEPEPEPLPT